MNKKQTQRLPLSSLRELAEQGASLRDFRRALGESAPFSTEDFAVLSHAHAGLVISRMVEPSVPYRIDDYRFLVFEDGEVEVTLNLQRCHFLPGTVAFVGNGSIIQFDRIIAPPTVSAIVLSGDYLRMVMSGRLPHVLNGSQHNFYFSVTNEELRLSVDMIDALRRLCPAVRLAGPPSGLTGPQQTTVYCQDSANALLAAVVHHMCFLYERRAQEFSAPKSRAQQVFRDFIALVNEHAAREHNLSFYASRLCITQRYLGSLVQQASGTSAKEWIDRAIITDAKVALRHSNITVTELSERLSFPNVSFFCKYFKRLTGLTPREYQEKSS